MVTGTRPGSTATTATRRCTPTRPRFCGNGKDDNCLQRPDGCEWSGPESLSGLELSSAEVNGSAGFSLAACDADGDQQLDVLMGDGNGSGLSGSAFLFYGPLHESRIASDADYVLEGTQAFAYAGFAVDCRGDIDADGAADFVIGMAGNSGISPGAAYVVAGGERGTGALEDEATSTWISGADVVGFWPIVIDDDGDGRDGIAVSVRPAIKSESAVDGTTYVIADVAPGVHDLESAASAYVYGTGADDQVFGAQGNVGDLDGDGLEELAVMVRDQDAQTGAVHLFHGPLNGALTTADADARITHPAEDFGTGMNHADLDDDGRADLLVGSPSNEEGTGSAFIFYGPVDDDVESMSADVQIRGTLENNAVGASFAAPDDGTNGLLVGAPWSSSERVLHLFGDGLTGSYDVEHDALAWWESDAARWAASDLATGDVTGDGILDFLVGGAADAKGGGVLVMPSFDL